MWYITVGQIANKREFISPRSRTVNLMFSLWRARLYQCYCYMACAGALVLSLTLVICGYVTCRSYWLSSLTCWRRHAGGPLARISFCVCLMMTFCLTHFFLDPDFWLVTTSAVLETLSGPMQHLFNYCKLSPLIYSYPHKLNCKSVSTVLF